MKVLLIPIDEYSFSVRVIGDDEDLGKKIISLDEYSEMTRQDFSDFKNPIEIPLIEGVNFEFYHANQ